MYAFYMHQQLTGPTEEPESQQPGKLARFVGVPGRCASSYTLASTKVGGFMGCFWSAQQKEKLIFFINFAFSLDIFESDQIQN